MFKLSFNLISLLMRECVLTFGMTDCSTIYSLFKEVILTRAIEASIKVGAFLWTRSIQRAFINVCKKKIKNKIFTNLHKFKYNLNINIFLIFWGLICKRIVGKSKVIMEVFVWIILSSHFILTLFTSVTPCGFNSFFISSRGHKESS